ncbi:MAG TPA: ROK family protein [Acidobacteriaceae bacterium]
MDLRGELGIGDAARVKTIVGLDLGGTKTACVEGTFGGEILQRVEMLTQAERPFAETFPAIADTLGLVMDRARAEGREIAAISVSVGGPLKIGEGILINPPHLPGWHGVALKAELEQRFPALQVYVEHDGNAGALAEFYFGVGKEWPEDKPELEHLIFLTVGTGIGAGIIVHGRVLRGASDTAGEVGHWRLAEDGPEVFGKRGGWESFRSGRGMLELAARMYPARWTPHTPIRELVTTMLADDRDALEVAAAAGRWLGRGVALLIDAFNPQVIVLGSLGVALGERVLGPAREVIAKEALPQAVAACELVTSRFGAGIGDVASLMAAVAVMKR